MSYDRNKAAAYAHQWAYGRNPAYYNFAGIGGDCTNFVSQCIHAGGAPMNYTHTFGWYYNSSEDRSPSWSGVEFLYNFLIKNKEAGPYGEVVGITGLEPGDIVQLSFTPGVFGHSLFVVKTGIVNNMNNVLIATHSDDSDNRPLSSYSQVAGYRYLKINVRNV